LDAPIPALYAQRNAPVGQSIISAPVPVETECKAVPKKAHYRI
jgi:hypothetical protein